MSMHTVGSPLMWAAFVAFVLAMIAIDLGFFQRKAHEVHAKEAAIWSLVWVGLATAFGTLVWGMYGRDRALEFAAGYVIEKALAVDNIFVFVVVFSTFAVPPKHQQRVLLWGILGALVMRAAFILAGSAFVQRFHWAMYVFGGLLLITGVKLLLDHGKTPSPEKNPLVRLFMRVFPSTSSDEGGHFFVRHRGKLFVTPLFLALVAVEVTDVIFAVDSIPAIFAVTTDPFIVFTSNIFAILGLRSLYFLLAGAVNRFHLLSYGLATVLLFVGAKMLIADFLKVPIVVSLLVILCILGASILASHLWPRRVARPADAAAPAAEPPRLRSDP